MFCQLRVSFSLSSQWTERKCENTDFDPDETVHRHVQWRHDQRQQQRHVHGKASTYRHAHSKAQLSPTQGTAPLLPSLVSHRSLISSRFHCKASPSSTPMERPCPCLNLFISPLPLPLFCQRLRIVTTRYLQQRHCRVYNQLHRR